MTLFVIALFLLPIRRGRAASPPQQRSTEKATVQRLSGYLKLGQPISGAVKDDPTNKVALTPIAGKVVYTFDVLNTNTLKNGLPIYLVIRDLNKRNASEQVTTYPLIRNFPKGSDRETNYYVAYDPQFSPDGQYVLFKLGHPVTNGTYELYVLNTKTKTLSFVVNQPLTYRKVLWSPDGNYLTYVSGGDANGGMNFLDYYLGPIRLYICNWRTGKEKLVATNDSILGNFSWAAPHTLLYGMLDEKTAKDKTRRPNIYQYSVEENKSTLLFHDGYYPTASPDGRGIAFFGTEDVDKPFPLSSAWLERPSDAALSVANYDGSNRQALNLEPDKYPYVIWQNESHFFAIQNKTPGFDIQQKVTLWDIKTKKFRIITTLNTNETENVVTAFVPIASSSFIKSTNVLYFIATGLVGREVDKKGEYMTREEMIYAMNTHSGSLSSIISLKHDWGIDFYLYPSVEG